MTTSAPYRRCRCGIRTFRIAPHGIISCSGCGDALGDRVRDDAIAAFSTEEWEDLFAAVEGRARFLELAIRRTGETVQVQAWEARLIVTLSLRDKVGCFVPMLEPKTKKKSKKLKSKS